MSQKQISVIGCGWLGLPLSEQLVRDGYQVKGSTTTPAKLAALQEKGVSPLLLSFPENSRSLALADALDADILIFNLPPSKTSTEANGYEQILDTVLAARPEKLRHLLFVSSTSVYLDLNRAVTEQDALASLSSPSLMLRCEAKVQQVASVSCTVVRLGGLMGGSRHPGRFLAGKENVPSPQGSVNMIHLTDAVAVLRQIIHQEKWGFTFNACAPEHPTREAFYTQAAHLLHLTPPQFQTAQSAPFKHINSDLLRKELAYTFAFPDPLACLSSPDF